MKKFVNCVMLLVFCFALVLPVAAEEPFVPSISYKGAPEVVPNENGDCGVLLNIDDWAIYNSIRRGCLLITPLSEVEESDEIPEDEKEWIINAYRKLLDRSMEIPYEEEFSDEEMVIRELFDLRLICDDGHIEQLNEGGMALEIILDLGISKDEKVSMMVYNGEEWFPAVRVVNNGDGTVSVAFDKLGLVAVSVPSVDEPAKTGDLNGSYVTTLSICAVAAAVVLAVLLVTRHRKATNK